MRKIVFLLLSASLLIQLCGCAQMEEASSRHRRKSRSAATTAETEAAELPTELAEATEAAEAPTEPQVLTPTTPVPYVLEPPAEACIFKEPDAKSAFVRVFGHEGAYTIVEERRHENGELWGRLKSGAGWVNLTDPFCGGPDVPLVVAAYSSKQVLSGDYHLAGLFTGNEYKVNVTILAHETVYDVRIMDVDDFSGKPVRTLYTLDELTPEKPLVAHLIFPGDLTTYAVVYTDANGIEHTITLWQSLDDSNMVGWF